MESLIKFILKGYSMCNVIFRKFKDSEEIIAYFLDYEDVAYVHNGQHITIKYDDLLKLTKPAKAQEYKALLSELYSVGYTDIKIRKRR